MWNVFERVSTSKSLSCFQSAGFNAVSRFEASSPGSEGSILTLVDVSDRLADTCHNYVPVTWQTSRAAPLAGLLLPRSLFSSPGINTDFISVRVSPSPPPLPPDHHHHPHYLSARHTQSHLLQKVMRRKRPQRFAWKVWRKVDDAVQKVNASSIISCKRAARQAEKHPSGPEVAGE